MILVGWVVRRITAFRLSIGQYQVCGIVGIVFGLILEPDSFILLAQNWRILAYTGIISVGLGYTLQAFTQKIAPPADAAIVLSLEAILVALLG